MNVASSAVVVVARLAKARAGRDAALHRPAAEEVWLTGLHRPAATGGELASATAAMSIANEMVEAARLDEGRREIADLAALAGVRHAWRVLAGEPG